MEKLDVVVARQAIEPTAPSFARGVLVLCVAGTAGFAVWKLSDVLVLAFGTTLLALQLRGLARELSRRTRIPEAWTVVPVALALLGAAVAAGWLFGSQLASQFNLLAKDLPQSLAQLAREVESSSWGAWFPGHAQDVKLLHQLQATLPPGLAPSSRPQHTLRFGFLPRFGQAIKGLLIHLK